MMRAVARGMIDPSRVCFHDVRWQNQMALLFEAIEREDRAEEMKAVIAFYGGARAGGTLESGSFQTTQKRMAEALQELEAVLRPWEGFTGEERRKRQDAWALHEAKSLIADPDAPGFKEWEAWAIARIQDTTIEADPELDELATIDRRLMQKGELDRARRGYR